MSLKQIEELKDRLFGRKTKTKTTGLTSLMEMIRQFGGLGELLGRTLEVYNPKGELVYTIRQRPMALSSAITLVKEAKVLRNLDAEIEAKKWSTKGQKGRIMGR